MNKLIYFMPALIIMIIIFLGSNDPASGEKSDFITKMIWRIIEVITGIKSDYSQEMGTSYIVRKIAHISEYALLNISIYFGIYKNSIRKNFQRNIILAVFISLLYSISDEFHQSFVPGRVGTYKDVLIDFSGILISSLIIKFFSKVA